MKYQLLLDCTVYCHCCSTCSELLAANSRYVIIVKENAIFFIFLRITPAQRVDFFTDKRLCPILYKQHLSISARLVEKCFAVNIWVEGTPVYGHV